MRNEASIALVVLTLCLMSPVTALACGSHDPTLLARGILNHIYPNSLHVIGAVQRARRAGELPPLDSTRLQARGDARAALDRIAFANTMSAVHALGVEMSRSRGQQPDVALVVLDTMLWTRFSRKYFDVRQGLHVDGPAPGDVVIVTDEPVVQSIQNGHMSIARAAEIGVLKVYATEQVRSELLDRIGSIGETPLQRSRFFAWSDFEESS